MVVIGEPHSARLARERLEAIKKYLPVRDAVKQQLQQRQESQVEFEENTRQLFKPITETTKSLLPVLEKTKVIGVISVGDLVKNIIEQQGNQIKFLETYIKGHSL